MNEILSNHLSSNAAEYQASKSEALASSEVPVSSEAPVSGKSSKSIEQFDKSTQELIEKIKSDDSIPEQSKEKLISTVENIAGDIKEFRISVDEANKRLKERISKIEIPIVATNPVFTPPIIGENPNQYPWENPDNIPDLGWEFPEIPYDILGEDDTGSNGEGFTIPEWENPGPPNYPEFIPEFPVK